MPPMSPNAVTALSHLRDPSMFKWYVIPLLVFVIYFYSQEIGRKNWSVVFAGLAFWGMDWFNEIWNSIVFRMSEFAPVWCAPGDTAYLIFVGLNIEICLMFSVMGLAAAHCLPEDPKMKIMGIPNRWFIGGVMSIACVLVEVVLNLINALTWDWSWWATDTPWLIWLIGYLPFFMVSYTVHDMKKTWHQAATVAGIFAFDGVLILIFGVGKGWL